MSTSRRTEDEVTVLAHLLDHADELGEGPVELVEDTVEEGRRHVSVHAQQLCHVLLQQQRRTRLCTNHTRAHWVTCRAATASGEGAAGGTKIGGAEGGAGPSAEEQREEKEQHHSAPACPQTSWDLCS